MMSLSVWAENISESLKTFSDLNFQIRVWINGNGPGFSSFGEEMCVLFDDIDFEGFLKLQEVYSNQKLFSSLNEIYLALNAITDEVMTDSRMNESFLKSPLWKRIIRLSEKAKKELDKARRQWKNKPK